MPNIEVGLALVSHIEKKKTTIKKTQSELKACTVLKTSSSGSLRGPSEVRVTLTFKAGEFTFFLETGSSHM